MLIGRVSCMSSYCICRCSHVMRVQLCMQVSSCLRLHVSMSVHPDYFMLSLLCRVCRACRHSTMDETWAGRPQLRQELERHQKVTACV